MNASKKIKKIKGSLAQQMAGQFILQREKDACLGTKRLGRPTTFFTLWTEHMNSFWCIRLWRNGRNG